MSLYSYKNQEPSLLPHRVRLDDGTTRTSLDELSLDDLRSIGFIGPIEKPKFEKNTHRIEWNGNSYEVIELTEQEIEKNMEENKKIELEEGLKNINYTYFLESLFQTDVYKKLRNAAAQSLSVNTLCTELIALFSSANKGNFDKEVIQIYINILFLTFSFKDEEIEEFQRIMNSSNLHLLYKLPSEEFISSHTYDYGLNRIIGPSPFESWTLINGAWEPPTPYPTDGKIYNWNEDSMSWIEI
jgi:hypothetical protein